MAVFDSGLGISPSPASSRQAAQEPSGKPDSREPHLPHLGASAMRLTFPLKPYLSQFSLDVTLPHASGTEHRNQMPQFILHLFRVGNSICNLKVEKLTVTLPQAVGSYPDSAFCHLKGLRDRFIAFSGDIPQ